MRRLMLAGVLGAALGGLAGIGHNMPPVHVPAQQTTHNQAVLPKRIIDENRRNQKLKQKLRRAKRRLYVQRFTRSQRKGQKFGFGYRPGKLFKGHRI